MADADADAGAGPWYPPARVRLSPTIRIALCALLPIVAIAELALAEVQKRRVPSDADWRAAAAAAKAAQKPGDMAIVAPRWASPLGRTAFGALEPMPNGVPSSSVVDLRSVARSDLEAVPRVLELSIRGEDDPQTKGWKLESERRFGHVALRTLINPHPDKLVRDLVDEFGQETPAGKLLAGGKLEPCRWETTASRIPNLFQGPGFPPQHFLCAPFDPAWSWVGLTVITDLSYTPRRCIFMHPSEAPTVVSFPARPIGKKVVAYVGLQVFSERELKGGAVRARIRVGDEVVAEVVHKDGDGWLRFEGSTAKFAGQSQPVRIETSAEASPQFRTACVAAQLRD